MKRNYEELRASLEFTQATVDSIVKENEDLKNRIKAMDKNYASLQQRVGDPIETCKAQNVSMEE